MKPRLVLSVVLLLGVGGVLAWRFMPGRQAAPQAKASGGGGGGAKGIPVVTATVALRDMPLWLSGLGTVQAFNTVTVRPRVSGTLDSINFTEGQSVKAGDVLAQIDPRPYRSALEQARAKKAQNEAQLSNARRELDRIRALVESDAESRRILEQQEASVAQLAAVARADQAAVEAAQLDLDFTTVRAPIAGRTGVRSVDAGNLVTANQGTGIVVITQLQPVSLVFTLPQQHLPALRRRLQADPSAPLVVAAGDQGIPLAQGKLDLIDNQIDTSTGTVRLKASFANDDTALWPGQFVNARILVETRSQAAVVPAEVVQAGLDGPFAYVIRSDSSVEARQIKPGPTVDAFTVIESGLKPGEQVVSDGQSKLQPGARVVAENPVKDAVKGRKPALAAQ
jgi:multidrug efflux system membrane fusion protein